MPPQSNAAGKRPAISAGLGHSAVATDKGELLVWGASRQFQLGLDRITDKERRNGKTEEDLPPPEDKHMPYPVPTLGTRPGAAATRSSRGGGLVAHAGGDVAGRGLLVGQQRRPSATTTATTTCASRAGGAQAEADRADRLRPDFSAALSESGRCSRGARGATATATARGDQRGQARRRARRQALHLGELRLGHARLRRRAATSTPGGTAAAAASAAATRAASSLKLVEALRELPCMLVAAGDSHRWR